MTAPSADPYDLKRFLTAQEPVIDQVRTELRVGIAGLGRSETARFYAIGSRDEAAAYLAHPVLGQRLVECTRLVNALDGASAEQIFGNVDAAKFRSCITLFAAAASEQTEFSDALRKYFRGAADEATVERI